MAVRGRDGDTISATTPGACLTARPRPHVPLRSTLAAFGAVVLLALLGALFGPSALDVPDEREGGR